MKESKSTRKTVNPTEDLPQTWFTVGTNLYNRFCNIFSKLNSKTFLRMCLVLSLSVSLAADAELSFQWRHTTDSVTSTPRKRVSLEWKYLTNQPVERLRFTRFENRSDTKVPVGEWTRTNGFKPNPFISTILHLKVEQLENWRTVNVSLTLEDPIYQDYELYYNCEVSFGHPESKDASIKLIMQRPEWKDSENDVEATVGQDVKFQWEYTYPYKSVAVLTIKQLVNDTENLEEIGFWFKGSFKTANSFMSRVDFSLIPQDYHTEKISLKLKNVTNKDFECYYICKLVLWDGEQTSNKQILKERRVKLVPPSTASTDESSTSPSCFTTVPVAVVTSIMFHLSKLWL